MMKCPKCGSEHWVPGMGDGGPCHDCVVCEWSINDEQQAEIDSLKARIEKLHKCGDNLRQKYHDTESRIALLESDLREIRDHTQCMWDEGQLAGIVNGYGYTVGGRVAGYRECSAIAGRHLLDKGK